MKSLILILILIIFVSCNSDNKKSKNHKQTKKHEKLVFKKLDIKELKNHKIYSLLSVKDKLYVGTNKGVFKIKGNKAKLLKESLKKKRFPSKHVISIKKDNNGNIYYATKKGLVIQKNKKFYKKHLNSRIMCFDLKTINGTVSYILGTDYGIIAEIKGRSIVQNASKPEFKILNKDGKKINVVEDKINSVAIGNNGEIFVATNNCAGKFKNNKWKQYLGDHQIQSMGTGQLLDKKGNVDIPGNMFNVVYIDKNSNNIYFGTQSGMAIMDKDENCTPLYSDHNKKVSRGSKIVDKSVPGNCDLVGNKIYVFFKDSKGALWIGTDKGVSRYKNGKFTNFKKDIIDFNYFDIYSIEEHNGKIYVGTDKGIYYINNNFKD